MPMDLSLIERHTSAITRISQKPTTGIIATLSDETFWSAHADLETVHAYWKRVDAFAHLHSGALLSLLEEHILPLERYYDYWRDKGIGEATTQQIIENANQLNLLKTNVFNALHQRCRVSREMNLPRHCDDVVALVISKLKEKTVVHDDFEKHTPSMTLNDDRRLTIYDYLVLAEFDKEQCYQDIVDVIPKRNFPRNPKLEKLKDKVLALHRYRNALYQKLRLAPYQSVLHFLYQQSVNVIENAIKKYQDREGALRLIVKARFALYFAVSLMAYYVLLQTLTPPILFLFGTELLSWVSGALFCTIGCAPLWGVAWQYALKGWNKCEAYFTREKQKSIYNALVFYEDATHFLYEKLDSTIIDLSHFDISDLDRRIDSLRQEINQLRIQLKRFSATEKFFVNAKLQRQAHLLTQKLKEVEQKLNKKCRRFSQSIAERIGEEIDQLEAAITQKALVPVLPARQVEQYAQFIQKYGTSEQIALFQQNSNAILRWVNQMLQDRYLMRRLEPMPLKTPWGTQEAREDSLNGWKIILQSFTPNAVQEKACFDLIDALKGVKILSPQQFEEAIAALALGDKQPLFREKCQAFIYNTLTGETASNAKLLSGHYKQEIAKWCEDHSEEIQQANQALDRFCEVPASAVNQEKHLYRYFFFLDAEDILIQSQGNPRKQRIREMLDNYQGDTGQIVYFLRFLPEHKRANIGVKIAEIRLRWALDNGFLLEEADSYLFHPYLHDSKSTFDFKRIVLTQKEKLQQDPALFKIFKESCRTRHFCSKKFLQELNEKPKVVSLRG